MEKERWLAYAIVLGPALVCVLIMLIVEFGSNTRGALNRKLNDECVLELGKEMTAHGAFYGSAVAGFFGNRNESSAYYIVSAIWFAICTYLAYILAKKVGFLKEGKVHV